MDDATFRGLKHRIETLEKNERTLKEALNELLESAGKQPLQLPRSPYARG